MVMSVTTQKTFPYMSDARTPAMDVQMTAQDVGMLRYFSVSLYSAMLIVDDGYDRRPSRGRSLRLRRKILFSSKRIWLPRYRVGNRPPPKEANLSHTHKLIVFVQKHLQLCR
jgi:hypothetical protein